MLSDKDILRVVEGWAAPIDVPIGIQWGLDGLGFGELWFSWDPEKEKVICASEMMSKEYVKKILCIMVDNCLLD